MIAALLNWLLSPIDIPLHTHCAGCGARLCRPTHGPGFCPSCGHSGNAGAAARLAPRIAAWIALAIIYAIAFHYAKKYEAEMLTSTEVGQIAAIG